MAPQVYKHIVHCEVKQRYRYPEGATLSKLGTTIRVSPSGYRYLCFTSQCTTCLYTCGTMELALQFSFRNPPPTKPPAKRKKAATPTPDPTSFPPGIWVRKLNYKAIGGASLPKTTPTKQCMHIISHQSVIIFNTGAWKRVWRHGCLPICTILAA